MFCNEMTINNANLVVISFCLNYFLSYHSRIMHILIEIANIFAKIHKYVTASIFIYIVCPLYSIPGSHIKLMHAIHT